VADAEFPGAHELEHVAAVDLHHAAEFGDDRREEAVEVNLGVDVGGEAVDDGLARFVHLHPALKRECLHGCAGHRALD
jgi:hypothetical protein